MAEKREGFKYITSLPEDEQFVAMMEYRGKIIIASTKSVYELFNEYSEGLRKIKIRAEDDTDAG